MKVTIKGFVHADPARSWEPADAPTTFTFFSFNATASGYLFVGPAEFEYEVPAGWNVTMAEVAVLEKQRDSILAESGEKLMKINKRLSELQCITLDQTPTVAPLDKPIPGLEEA